MSVYSVKGKGWRYDFTRQGTRYTDAWFKTKAAARKAEAQKREELESPEKGVDTQTDMAFLELVNRRLDHVKAYNSESHYRDYVYMAKRWVKQWGEMPVVTVTREMVVKYVPSAADVDRVIAAADPATQDYLWTIRETMARVSEVNQLTWDEIDLDARLVVLYTRKKKGGHRTPRKIPMSEKLFEVLSRRFVDRDPSKPWVFWQTYWSSKTGEKKEGPYQDRKKFMRTLCEKAGMRYFRFHALQHAGASLMENSNVPVGSIQRILGHESRMTTEIYLHGLGDAERQAILVYEQARQKSHTESHTAKK